MQFLLRPNSEKKKKNMPKYDRITALIFFFLSLGICIESVRISIGSFNQPGPGLISFLSGVFLGLFSVILYIGNIKKEKIAKNFWENEESGKAILLTIATLFGYALLFEILGFLVCNIALLIIIARFVGNLGWKKAISLSSFTSVAGYVIFGIWLQSPLPKWILEDGLLWIYRRLSF
jgi:putative tricarboxylic transport membrane protein